MDKKPRRTPRKRKKGVRGQTSLIELRPSIKQAVVRGMELGLSYEVIARSVGVSGQALSNWMKRCREVEDQFAQLGLSEEEIVELGKSNGEIEEQKKKWIERYGEGVVSLVIEKGFWLGLICDLKEAEGKAEGKMLGVIEEAAMGHRVVTETRTEEITLRQGKGKARVSVPALKTTTTKKELGPRWQAAAWFLERKWPEKYSQRKITDDIPADIPYEVLMTSKLLLQLPKIELERVIKALKERIRPQQPQLPRLTEGKGVN